MDDDRPQGGRSSSIRSQFAVDGAAVGLAHGWRGACSRPAESSCLRSVLQMALFDSCWRFRDGTDHIEVEAYPRCVEPEQRARSLMELGGLLHRFAAADVAVRTVMLDVHGRLSGHRAPDVNSLSILAWMREDLVSAAKRRDPGGTTCPGACLPFWGRPPECGSRQRDPNKSARRRDTRMRAQREDRSGCSRLGWAR